MDPTGDDYRAGIAWYELGVGLGAVASAREAIDEIKQFAEAEASIRGSKPMTTENKYKVGDRVLVEAEVVGLNLGCSVVRVLPVGFSEITPRPDQWADLRVVHPSPDPATPRLIPVDLDGGDGEYPKIPANAVRIGDVVRSTIDCPNLTVYGVKDGVSWVSPSADAPPFTAWGHPWLLIERDGQDQRKTKRLRWCDLPEVPLLIDRENGGWFDTARRENRSPQQIPPGTRVWRMVFPD